MTASSAQTFKRNYENHRKHLRLKGLRPKTIEAYARAIRRIGQYFEYEIEDLSEQQLTDYLALNQRSCHQVQLQPVTSSMPSRAPMSKGKMPYGLICP
jgi:hypothetical protein